MSWVSVVAVVLFVFAIAGGAFVSVSIDRRLRSRKRETQYRTGSQDNWSEPKLRTIQQPVPMVPEDGAESLPAIRPQISQPELATHHNDGR